jgi:putative flavoprotein involved in K+ transport
MKDAQGNRVTFMPDLHDNLAKVDQSVADFKQKVDEIIESRGIAAEEAADRSEMRDGYQAALIEELDLAAEGITTVIWATGYRFDFSWIKFPLLDQDGYPIQERGISDYPGLYFLGLNWLYRRSSGLLLGVAEDAAHVAAAIAVGG